MANGDRPKVEPAFPAELARAPAPLPGMRVEENVYVPMRDGVLVEVDIFKPEKEGKYPVLFSHSPYMKDLQRKPPYWSHAIESGAHAFYVDNGYIHVIAQGRGCGRSQGKWALLSEPERTDGYDIIEWIAQQDWCDGNVGMIGDSYWSWTQYWAALSAPPHLKCTCQCDSTPDPYRDVFYQGGIFNHEFCSAWAQYMTAQTMWPGKVEGKEPPMNLHYEIISRPCFDDWYRERSAWDKLEQIKVPALHICPQGGALHFRGQLWGWPRIGGPKKLMVVPPTGFWSHVRFLTHPVLNRQMLRWFDYWLKGIDNGIMDEPPVAIFDSATRAWRYENEYPLKRTEWVKYHFHGKGSEAPWGTLELTEPKSNDAPDSYRMPDGYERLTKGEPVLAYQTPPLEAPLRLWGPLSVTLHAASSQPDTAFFIHLFDVPPEGPPAPISRGMFRASHRAVDRSMSKPGQPFHPYDKQELLTPGEVYEIEIELRPVCRTILDGHRLQLRIASEDLSFNNFLRTIDVLLLPWPVENTIHHDATRPSHLLLPVVPDAPEIAPVEAPLSEIEWPLVPGSWSPHTDGWPLRGKV